MKFTYRFPAVRGTQAGNEYYISMVPLKLLSKLFINLLSNFSNAFLLILFKLLIGTIIFSSSIIDGENDLYLAQISFPLLTIFLK